MDEGEKLDEALWHRGNGTAAFKAGDLVKARECYTEAYYLIGGEGGYDPPSPPIK